MKVLVIGSKGFIGSHAYRFFEGKGSCEVFGCDIHSSKEKNYFKMDVFDSNFDPIFRKHAFDICLNAAGSASVPFSMQNPVQDFQLNTGLLLNILESLRQYNPACKLINISSAAVYGSPKQLPIQEGAITVPLSPYGFHKLQSELLCKEYATVFGLHTCSLRVFSTFGPGLSKQIFWDLYQKSVNSQNVCLYGDGDESRDFIYIDDLLQVLDLVFKKGDFKGESLNVGNGEEIYIRDAVTLFYKYLGWDGKVSFTGQDRKGDPKNWKADISTISRLGYERGMEFEKGLENYVKWLKERE